MTYYCDNKRHLVCYPYSISNLHAMALELGIKRIWFNVSYYEIPKHRVKEIMSKSIEVQHSMILTIINNKKFAF